jgi:hypothetical protein
MNTKKILSKHKNTTKTQQKHNKNTTKQQKHNKKHNKNTTKTQQKHNKNTTKTQQKHSKTKKHCKQQKGGGYEIDEKNNFIYKTKINDGDIEETEVGYIKFHVDKKNMIIGWVYIYPGIYSEIPGESIKFRGKGYGKQMIKEFEDYVKKDYKDITNIQLVPEYYSGKRAERIKGDLCEFYEKLGFKQLADDDPTFNKKIRPNKYFFNFWT